MATNNTVNTTLSGQTGTGNFVGSTSPTLTTPTLGAASATSLSFSSTSGIIGTTTNNNAAAGSVGEILTATGSSVSLTTTSLINVTSVSLTAGDWDVHGSILFNPAANLTVQSAGISNTSATLPAAPFYIVLQGVTFTGVQAHAVPYQRISLSGTTTYYLVAQNTFTSTCTATGTITARRIR